MRLFQFARRTPAVPGPSVDLVELPPIPPFPRCAPLRDSAASSPPNSTRTVAVPRARPAMYSTPVGVRRRKRESGRKRARRQGVRGRRGRARSAFHPERPVFAASVTCAGVSRRPRRARRRRGQPHSRRAQPLAQAFRPKWRITASHRQSRRFAGFAAHSVLEPPSTARTARPRSTRPPASLNIHPETHTEGKP